MFPVVSRTWPAAEGHGRELVVGLSETFPLSSLGLFSCCVPQSDLNALSIIFFHL